MTPRAVKVSLAMSVALCLAASCASIAYHVQTLERLAQIERRLNREEPRVLTTEWQSGGQKRVLTTTRSDGESFDDFVKRHIQEVADAQVLLPPDAK